MPLLNEQALQALQDFKQKLNTLIDNGFDSVPEVLRNIENSDFGYSRSTLADLRSRATQRGVQDYPATFLIGLKAFVDSLNVNQTQNSASATLDNFSISYTPKDIRGWQTDKCLRPANTINILTELLTVPQLLNLTGEEGQGKTRLLNDIKYIAKEQKMQVALLNLNELRLEYENFFQAVSLQLGLDATKCTNFREVAIQINQQNRFFLLMIDDLEVLHEYSDNDPLYNAKFVQSLNLLKDLGNTRLLFASRKPLNEVVFYGQTSILTLEQTAIVPLTAENIENEVKRRLDSEHPFWKQSYDIKELSAAVQQRVKPFSLLTQVISRLISHYSTTYNEGEFKTILKDSEPALPSPPKPTNYTETLKGNVIIEMIWVEGGTFKMFGQENKNWGEHIKSLFLENDENEADKSTPPIHETILDGIKSLFSKNNENEADESTSPIHETILDGIKSLFSKNDENEADKSKTPIHETILDDIKSLFLENDENEANESENHIHEVTLNSFCISKYPVTQAQWKSIMRENPSHFKGDNLPVEQVSWDDAVEFCQRLSDLTQKKYRLPTEAEWEYAARGGNKSFGYKYAGSKNIDTVAWYEQKGGATTCPVGQKNANELGLYDMSGNVWEWCGDWYAADYYKNSPKENPNGPDSGDSRVLRGGGWDSNEQDCRVALRHHDLPDNKCFKYGFRLLVEQLQ